MDTSPPVDIGSDFLGYRIEELIGRGGMGVVYRAYDLRLKRPVALKLVAPSLARDERFRERFARESELVMSLEHPNVVPIYDAGDVDGRVYLAMRLVDGSDLGSVLRAEAPLEPARAVAICAQIAAALDAAHASGLVHRDVKPSNVLLDGSEHVYLADFGLTRRLDDQWTESGLDRSIGTPAYLAPEQLEAGPVDGRADVYSLGCVLYECLTGEAVFPRDSRLAVAWAHLEDEPPTPSGRRAGLPEAIDAVIGKALAKEPEQRYPTCAELISAAREALGLGTGRPPRRRRTLLLAGVALLAVAAAAAVAATSLARGAPKKLLAGPDKLVRIDPATKKVIALIPVGLNPVMAAGSGPRVWVYSEGSGTISQVDTQTNSVVQREPVSSLPPAGCCGINSGPVLAADASGAWFVTGGLVSKPLLVHVPVGLRGRREYPLEVTPTGVAVGSGSVWVVGHSPRYDAVLRIDPVDGRVTATRRFPVSARIDSIAFGYGHVWLVSSVRSALYRLDPQLTLPPRRVPVADSRATRPELVGGVVWVRAANGETIWYDPSSLLKTHWEFDAPPKSQENVWAFDNQWWYDSSSGRVFWQHGVNYAVTGMGRRGTPKHGIPVTRASPSTGGPCLTSITTGGGSVWVTAAPLVDPGNNFVCRR
ncbi:MAG TPA: protein kinase [Gaiellaceae bacterium]|nr:protein kinase [Gaiellaceae bacterium]